MTIRITQTRNGPTRTVRIQGRLEQADVPEVHRICAAEHGRLLLDLSELRGFDEAGRKAILSCIRGGAELASAPLYIRLLINSRRGRAAAPVSAVNEAGK